MNRLALLLGTWFGCGLAPLAPGTVGSVGALIVAWPLVAWCGFLPWHFPALAAVFTLPGMWAAGRTAAIKGLKDPQIVVVDEVLGQWIALGGAAALDPPRLLAAFALFRLFDIVKPWPVRRLEALPGGVGIVADDLAAGAYAALVLYLSRFVVQF
ncbi:MAG: phosphatidylglycerophosphatase A [Candidatus Solibacter usitatus]|nr:phosphatidylglycerophosphatase A [Candidatus Solibacter usitatus]